MLEEDAPRLYLNLDFCFLQVSTRWGDFWARSECESHQEIDLIGVGRGGKEATDG